MTTAVITMTKNLSGFSAELGHCQRQWEGSEWNDPNARHGDGVMIQFGYRELRVKWHRLQWQYPTVFTENVLSAYILLLPQLSVTRPSSYPCRLPRRTCVDHRFANSLNPWNISRWRLSDGALAFKFYTAYMACNLSLAKLSNRPRFLQGRLMLAGSAHGHIVEAKQTC